MIKPGNNHVFVCGLTQSGKSYFSHRAMLSMPFPVLYFNIQGEDVPPGFLTVNTWETEMAQVVETLKEGQKVNLVFTDVKRGYSLIAGYIFESLMEAGFSSEHPIYVGVDECHLLQGYSLEMAKVVATAGLKKGVRCIWITQRPAIADKTLYTQAFDHYMFFLTEAEAGYMKTKGIDFDFCKREWERLGKHSYCYYNGYTCEGRKGI